MATITPFAPNQYLDDDGNPLAGGKLNWYVGGSVNTRQDTYTDNGGLTANPNPCVLDSTGRFPGGIWFSDSLTYKLVITDSDDVVIDTVDNITSVGGVISASYVRRDGTTAMTANWAFGAYTLTGMTAVGLSDTGTIGTATTPAAVTFNAAGDLTLSDALTVAGLITANGGVALGAGDNLTGSSTSAINLNSGAFTAAGATGNTVVGGTLGVTGISTLTGLVTAEANLTAKNVGNAEIIINADSGGVSADTDAKLTFKIDATPTQKGILAYDQGEDVMTMSYGALGNYHMKMASTGAVTLSDALTVTGLLTANGNIVVPNDGTIGSVDTPATISIGSTGSVTLAGDTTITNGNLEFGATGSAISFPDNCAINFGDNMSLTQSDDGGAETLTIAGGEFVLGGIYSITMGTGSIFMGEKVNAYTDVAGSGQFWIKTATPNRAMFTDDAGNDLDIVGSSATTGGTGSAGAGNQYVELRIAGTVYKVLHDGQV